MNDKTEKNTRHVAHCLMAITGMTVPDMVDYTGDSASSIRNWMEGRGKFVPFIATLIDIEERVRSGNVEGLPNNVVYMSKIRRLLIEDGNSNIMDMLGIEEGAEKRKVTAFASMTDRMEQMAIEIEALKGRVEELENCVV